MTRRPSFQRVVLKEPTREQHLVQKLPQNALIKIQLECLMYILILYFTISHILFTSHPQNTQHDLALLDKQATYCSRQKARKDSEVSVAFVQQHRWI